MQNCGMPPPPLCKLGGILDYTKGMFGPFVSGLHPSFLCSSPNFGRKIGLILGEDLFYFFWVKTFFFAFHLILFGRKIGLILNKTMFFPTFTFLKFCEVPMAPPWGSFCAFRTNTKIRRSANSVEYL